MSPPTTNSELTMAWTSRIEDAPARRLVKRRGEMRALAYVGRVQHRYTHLAVPETVAAPASLVSGAASPYGWSVSFNFLILHGLLVDGLAPEFSGRTQGRPYR
jgi:hypothetical protein